MSLYKDFVVIRKVNECNGVVSLYLRPADGVPLPAFKPGQHLLFKMAVPGQEIPAFRYYSFSDQYHPDYYRISVKKERPPAYNPALAPGLCSSHIVDAIREGNVLQAKGPSGDFWLTPEEEHPVVLIAGGIGITPLLSMLKSIAITRPKREVYFYYGVNENCEHAFKNELDALKKAHPHFRIIVHYAKVAAGDVAGTDYDEEGFINMQSVAQNAGDQRVHYYICGPEPMMKYVTTGLQQAGVAAERIHTESFKKEEGERLQTMEPVLNDGPKANGADTELTVEFLLSGKKLTWDKRYRSLLEFAEANDVDISSSCLFGDCGSCLTSIVEGEVQYIHPTLIKPTPGKCLPCSSIPAGNVVLKA